MAIRFRCRSCRRLLSVGTRKAGHDVSCPICGRNQQVPVPFAAAHFSFPRTSRSSRGSESQPRWATWDGALALALGAGGITIALLVCLVVRSTYSKRDLAAPQKTRNETSKLAAVPLVPINAKPAKEGAVGGFEKLPAPLNTKKPIAMVAESAPKLSPAAGTLVATVRPAPSLESAAPKVEAPKPVTFSMKRRQNRNEEDEAPIAQLKSQFEELQVKQASAANADFVIVNDGTYGNLLIRTSQGKEKWAEEAYQRGVKAEKYGNDLLAQTCYWNALAIYPNTSSAQRAKAAYDRLNAAQAKENLIRLAGKRFGKPDCDTLSALADINDMDQLEFLTSRVPQASSWQQLLNPKSASYFRTTVSARARNLDRTWTPGQTTRD